MFQRRAYQHVLLHSPCLLFMCGLVSVLALLPLPFSLLSSISSSLLSFPLRLPPLSFLSPSKIVVAGFSGRMDLGKAAETANEVQRMVKELKSVSKMLSCTTSGRGCSACLYTSLSLSLSSSLVWQSVVWLTPYKNLWVTTAKHFRQVPNCDHQRVRVQHRPSVSPSQEFATPTWFLHSPWG